MWGEVCGPEGERAWGSGGRKRGAHAEDPRLEGLGQSTRGGAHPEHVGHDRDAGGVEAQRLVEHRRGLPRVERGACGTGRSSGQEAGGGGGPRRTQGAGEGSNADWE